MIRSIHYKNYKALRDAILPLGRFTLLLGPNASGKSTAMQAIQASNSGTNFQDIVTADLKRSDNVTVEVAIEWAFDDRSEAGSRKKLPSRVVEPVVSRRPVTLKSTWH